MNKVLSGKTNPKNALSENSPYVFMPNCSSSSRRVTTIPHYITLHSIVNNKMFLSS